MGKDSKKEKEKEKPPVPTASLPTLEPCGICLEKIAFQGALPCCKHSFCFPCIQHWAKVTNRCPICKQAFKFITEILPEGKEKQVKVKAKEQDHQYTLEELDEAIGDDDSEDEGPEWYFIDRDAEEASDDEDEEGSIERQRKEGYHYYDNLHNEIEKLDQEESRDSRSIELSDQDWAAQDRESYSSDGGFVVDDEHVSYSQSEDSLDLADQGKVRRKRRSSDMEAILSTESAEKLIKKAKKKSEKSKSKNSSSSSSDSDSDSQSKKKKGKKEAKGELDEEDMHKTLLTNFRELMYNRRFTPKRRRLRKLAKRLSMSPTKAKGPLIASEASRSSKNSKSNFKSEKNESLRKKDQLKPKRILLSSSRSSSSSSSNSSESDPPKLPKKAQGKSKEPELRLISKSNQHSVKAPSSVQSVKSQTRPTELFAGSAKLLEDSKKPSSSKKSPDSKHKSSQTASSVIDLSQSPATSKTVGLKNVSSSNPAARPPAPRQVINLVSPSPSPHAKRHNSNRPAQIQSSPKVVEIPKIVTKAPSTAVSHSNFNTEEAPNKKRKREEEVSPKSHVQKKSKKK